MRDNPHVSAQTLVELACREMSDRWAVGEKVPVEHFLIRFPTLLDDADGLLDLILLELVLRESLGESPSEDEFLNRFPSLGQSLRDQLGFHFRLHQSTARAIPNDSPHQDSVAGYQIVRELGRGGMGTVYEAIQPGLNRRVALKMIPRELPVGPLEAQRFSNEADALARLNHPGIVQIYEVGLHDGRPFIAFELMRGGTLGDLLKAGPLSPRDAATLLLTLTRAIEVVHSYGIIHRDLKPANVLFPNKDDGGPRVPKLTDFGLAKLVDSGIGLTRTGDALGTPGYMAPEQLIDGSGIGPQADIYGLGTILYEMLTGQAPFHGTTAAEALWQVRYVDPLPPSRLKPSVPRDLQTICLKCLEKSPQRRYPSAANLADDLERYLAGKPIRARSQGLVGRSVKQIRRRPLVAGLLGVLVLSILGGLGGIFWQWREAVRLAKAEVHQRQQAEKHLYGSRISQASLLWQSNDLVGARDQLKACIPLDGHSDFRGWEWYYLTQLCSGQKSEFAQLPYWINNLAVSPDGNQVAAAVGRPADLANSRGDKGSVGALVVWSKEGKELWRHGSEETHSAAYSPDGSRLAITTQTGKVAILDRDKRIVLWEMVERGPAFAIRFHPTNGQVAYVWKSSAQQGGIVVRDGTTGKEEARLQRSVRESLTYSADGQQLLTVLEADGAICSWNPTTGNETIVRTQRPLTSDLGVISGSRIVSIGVGGGMAWNFDPTVNTGTMKTMDGQEVFALSGQPGTMTSVAVAPNRKVLATGGADQVIRIWNATNGRENNILRGHLSKVRSLAFDPEGAVLYTGGQDGAVRRWNIDYNPRGRLWNFRDNITISPGQVPRVCAVALTADGKMRAARVGGEVKTWDRTTGKLVSSALLPDGATSSRWPMNLMEFVGDGSRIAYIAKEDRRIVHIADADTGVEQFQLAGHTRPVMTVAVSSNGKWIATAAWADNDQTKECELKIWDAADGRMRNSIVLQNISPYVIAISKDAQWIATGGSVARGTNPTINLWRVNDGEVAVLPQVFTHDISALTFSPDGNHLVAAGFIDPHIALFDTLSRQCVAQQPGCRAATRITYSPAGNRFALIGYDGVVSLHDAVDGSILYRLPGLTEAYRDDPATDSRVAFSPDGQWMISTNWNASFNLWEAQPDSSAK